MSKKVHHKKSSHKSHAIHRRLEQPVHNLVGYGVLFILSIVTLFLVMKLPH